jgi:hypothetical protein
MKPKGKRKGQRCTGEDERERRQRADRRTRFNSSVQTLRAQTLIVFLSLDGGASISIPSHQHFLYWRTTADIRDRGQLTLRVPRGEQERWERDETNRGLPPEQQQLLSGGHLRLIHAGDLSRLGWVHDSGFEENEGDRRDGAARGLNVAMSPLVVAVEAAGRKKKVRFGSVLSYTDGNEGRSRPMGAEEDKDGRRKEGTVELTSCRACR